LVMKLRRSKAKDSKFLKNWKTDHCNNICDISDVLQGAIGQIQI
jgi:hypothetical protein